MKKAADQDQNTTTASGTAPDKLPTNDEIAARAHQMWLEQGKPCGLAEQNWLEAERQIKAERVSRAMLKKAEDKSGSVQS